MPHLSPRVLARPAPAALGALLAGAALSACGSSGTPPAASSSDANAVSPLTVTDPWVKSADSGMTAGFGTLVNDGARDVVVTGVTSTVSPTMQLHETVAGDGGAMQMQEKDDGFTVPAGGELALTPGGDHLMLMDLRRPLRPGEDVTFALELADGSTQEFSAVVKDFSGADEEYVAGHGS